MDQLMNNPQMMAMAQAMMQDPEVMALMQRPGMMERLQAAMANPALAMQDPEVAEIAMKMQGRMGGMGGGGMGGFGGGGFGATPSAAAGSTPSLPSDIKHVTTSAELDALLTAAGHKLVAVDYFTTWCGPCKMIAPLFSSLAAQYRDKVVFVKIDGDQARELCMEKGIRGFPTFEFYVAGQKIDSFSGADQSKLQRIVEEHGEAAPPEPACPYQHFPLKENEMVHYKDIKWPMVEGKFRELNAKLADGDMNKLTDAELASIDSLIKTLQDKTAYHSTTVTAVEFATFDKLLATWPQENLGPVANVLRMAVLHPVVAKRYADGANKKDQTDILPLLLRHATTASKSVLALLIFRLICNGFARRALGKALAGRSEELLEAAAEVYRRFGASDENIRLTIIATYINLAILFAEDIAQYEQAIVLLLTNVQEVLQLQIDGASAAPAAVAPGGTAGPASPAVDAKVIYRALIVLGTVIYKNANAAELARDLDLLDVVQRAAALDPAAKDAQIQQAKDELTQTIKAGGK